MKEPGSRYNIEVSDKDIARAQVNDSYKCVVAQAIARCVPDATYIEVDTQAIRFSRMGERFVYLTPYAVQGYVIAFDAGEPIESFRFQLRNPQRVARRTRTKAGKAADAAAARVYADRRKVSSAKGKANAANVDARAAYAEVTNNAKEPLTESKGGRKAPPRVFKSKRRSYGHRLLRINQEEV